MKLYYILLFTVTISADYNPNNTIIAFDLNDVLVHKDVSAITKKASKLLLKPKTWRYALSPFFWNKLTKYASEKSCKESVFIKLIEDYPALADFEYEYIDLATSHTIDKDALNLVQQLKSCGYKLYIFTNMGAKSMAYMSKKYSELFSYFDGYYCPSLDNNYNSKPNISFYNQFLDYVAKNGDNNKQVIFVDDRKKNIKAAKQVGFSPILCKSIKDVFAEMQKLNIFSHIATRKINKMVKSKKFKKK